MTSRDFTGEVVSVEKWPFKSLICLTTSPLRWLLIYLSWSLKFVIYSWNRYSTLPLHIIEYSCTLASHSMPLQRGISEPILRGPSFRRVAQPEPAASPGLYLCHWLGRPCLQPPCMRGRKSPTRAQFGSRIVSFFPQLFHIHATCARSLKLRNQPPSSPSKNLPTLAPQRNWLWFQKSNSQTRAMQLAEQKQQGEIACSHILWCFKF